MTMLFHIQYLNNIQYLLHKFSEKCGINQSGGSCSKTEKAVYPHNRSAKVTTRFVVVLSDIFSICMQSMMCSGPNHLHFV